MSSDVVLAEPIHDDEPYRNSGVEVDGEQFHEVENEQFNQVPFARSRTYRQDNLPEPFDSERLPVTLGSEIRKFLRLANQLEVEEPRVAYLCRFHALVKAQIMDRNSTGRVARQFKTALLQRLERDMQVTLERRKAKSDVRELRRVYNGYTDYIKRCSGTDDFAYRKKLVNAHAIASALFEVLQTATGAAGHQALADRDSIETVSELHNTLPLHRGGANQAIMQLHEIKASILAVRNARGLPFMNDIKKSRRGVLRIFDWLRFCFGLQTGNAANQREHLIYFFNSSDMQKK